MLVFAALVGTPAHAQGRSETRPELADPIGRTMLSSARMEAVLRRISGPGTMKAQSQTVSPSWSQQATLADPPPQSFDLFGYSAVMDGNTVLVGAPARNNDAGAVYMFVRSGTAWTQQAVLIPHDAVPGDSLGYFTNSLAVDGNTALIGAPGKNNFAGAAYVFVRNGTTWSEQAELTAGDGQRGDVFGNSVALS